MTVLWFLPLRVLLISDQDKSSDHFFLSVSCRRKKKHTHSRLSTATAGRSYHRGGNLVETLRVQPLFHDNSKTPDKIIINQVPDACFYTQ